MVLQARASEASASAAAGSALMRCSAAEQKAEIYEEHLSNASQVVDQLKEGISTMFEAIVSQLLFLVSNTHPAVHAATCSLAQSAAPWRSYKLQL